MRRAILVGGDPLALRGLRDYLAALPDLAILSEAMTAEAAISSVAYRRPDLLFLQPECFDNAGLDICRVVRTRFSAVKVIVITHRTEIDVVLAYLRLGVAAYFRSDRLEDLAGDIDTVIAGRAILGRSLAQDIAELIGMPAVLAALRSAPVAGTNPPAYTAAHACGAPRREAVLELAGEGLSNKEIANVLGIRPSTVAEHLRRYRALVGPIPRAAIGSMRRNRGRV